MHEKITDMGTKDSIRPLTDALFFFFGVFADNVRRPVFGLVEDPAYVFAKNSDGQKLSTAEKQDDGY